MLFFHFKKIKYFYFFLFSQKLIIIMKKLKANNLKSKSKSLLVKC